MIFSLVRGNFLLHSLFLSLLLLQTVLFDTMALQKENSYFLKFESYEFLTHYLKKKFSLFLCISLKGEGESFQIYPSGKILSIHLLVLILSILVMEQGIDTWTKQLFAPYIKFVLNLSSIDNSRQDLND